ncbi:hypothetical protein ACVWZW_004755 [Bradyrhizobium sp. F1.13.4]
MALVNSYMIMMGALVAVTATAPAEALLNWIGWRDLFELIAASSATAPAVIDFWFLSRRQVQRAAGGTVGLKTVYTDGADLQNCAEFFNMYRIRKGLQSLWAASWLSDVEGLDRTSLVTQLLVMATALSIGAWCSVRSPIRCAGMARTLKRCSRS